MKTRSPYINSCVLNRYALVGSRNFYCQITLRHFEAPFVYFAKCIFGLADGYDLYFFERRSKKRHFFRLRKYIIKQYSLYKR